jgi:uncharacterized SAM-binding protein YcdF (DUF218 family)
MRAGAHAMSWRGRHRWLLAIGLVIVAWLGGLAWFIGQVPTTAPSQDSVTDAIVVLTGGSQRV